MEKAIKLELLPRADDKSDAKVVRAPGDGDPRTMSRVMTKFERAQVIGMRALQLEQGAPVMVELKGETDPVKIARRELTERRLPLIVRRYFPDSVEYEDWDVNELVLSHVD